MAVTDDDDDAREIPRGYGHEESISVVILCRDSDDEMPKLIAGRAPVDLDDPAGLARSVVADALDSTVRLTAPMDVPFELIDDIHDLPVPTAFQPSGWLSDHRALIFHNGRFRVGSHDLTYDDDLGLSIAESP